MPDFHVSARGEYSSWNDFHTPPIREPDPTGIDEGISPDPGIIPHLGQIPPGIQEVGFWVYDLAGLDVLTYPSFEVWSSEEPIVSKSTWFICPFGDYGKPQYQFACRQGLDIPLSLYRYFYEVSLQDHRHRNPLNGELETLEEALLRQGKVLLDKPKLRRDILRPSNQKDINYYTDLFTLKFSPNLSGIRAKEYWAGGRGFRDNVTPENAFDITTLPRIFEASVYGVTWVYQSVSWCIESYVTCFVMDFSPKSTFPLSGVLLDVNGIPGSFENVNQNQAKQNALRRTKTTRRIRIRGVYDKNSTEVNLD
jgi:hypothetical protein